MKTIETTTEIPSQTITTTMYACDECSFESEFEDEAKDHEREEHSFTEKRSFEGHTFMRFETEERFRRWASHPRWDGPGWYRKWLEHVPCGRGCCYDEREMVESLQTFIKSLRDEAVKLTAKADRLTKLGDVDSE